MLLAKMKAKSAGSDESSSDEESSSGDDSGEEESNDSDVIVEKVVERPKELFQNSVIAFKISSWNFRRSDGVDLTIQELPFWKNGQLWSGTFWNNWKAKKVFKRRNQNIDKSGHDDFSAPVQLPMPQNGDLQTPSQIMDRLLQADEKDES